MTKQVRLHEVSLRDGLQNEPEILPAAVKLGLLERLVAAGFTDIEVTSFVRPRFVPQLADAAEVARNLPQAEGVRFWALVPNPVGLDRALDAEIRHIATFLSSSETHNKKNVNRTIAESLSGLRRVIGTAVGEGLEVRAYVSTVFGCPYEGPIDVERVLDLSLELLDCGAGQLSLGDTTGVANPIQVRQVLDRLVEGGVPLERIAVHFHDTRGTALVNSWAAWERGVRIFDGAIAGVGGCPYAPGAAGNVATEDLLWLFDQVGVETGVDFDRACEAGGYLEEVLGRPLPGRVHRSWMGSRDRAAGQAARSA